MIEAGAINAYMENADGVVLSIFAYDGAMRCVATALKCLRNTRKAKGLVVVA